MLTTYFSFHWLNLKKKRKNSIRLTCPVHPFQRHSVINKRPKQSVHIKYGFYSWNSEPNRLACLGSQQFSISVGNLAKNKIQDKNVIKTYGIRDRCECVIGGLVARRMADLDVRFCVVRLHSVGPFPGSGRSRSRCARGKRHSSQQIPPAPITFGTISRTPLWCLL